MLYFHILHGMVLSKYVNNHHQEQKEVSKLKHYRPSDMFTEEDVKLLIDACTNLRDKFIVATLYDGALRPHELLKMHIADVTIHEKYCQITIPEDTKTGTRTIPIIGAFAYIRDWLNCHPLKHDSEACLCIRNRGVFRRDFTRKNGRAGNESRIDYYHFRPNMDYVTLWFMFHQLKGRVNHLLKKRYWYPYMLRHSRLTVLANILTDQQLKKFAGWTPDSNMPSVYIHLSGKELDEPLLLQHGLIKKEDQTRPALTIKVCPRCSHMNQVTNKLCDKCSLPLTVQGFEEIKKKEEEQEMRLQRVEQDNAELKHDNAMLMKDWKAMTEEMHGKKKSTDEEH